MSNKTLSNGYISIGNINDTAIYSSEISLGDEKLSVDDIKFLHEVKKSTIIDDMNSTTKEEYIMHDIDIRVADNGFIATTKDRSFVFENLDKLTRWVTIYVKESEQNLKVSECELSDSQRKLLEITSDISNIPHHIWTHNAGTNQCYDGITVGGDSDGKL